jgi:hypothetical protein
MKFHQDEIENLSVICLPLSQQKMLSRLKIVHRSSHNDVDENADFPALFQEMPLSIEHLHIESSADLITIRAMSWERFKTLTLIGVSIPETMFLDLFAGLVNIEELTVNRVQSGQVSLKRFLRTLCASKLFKLCIGIQETWCSDTDVSNLSLEFGFPSLQDLELLGDFVSFEMVKTLSSFCSQISRIEAEFPINASEEPNVVEFISSCLANMSRLTSIRIHLKCPSNFYMPSGNKFRLEASKRLLRSFQYLTHFHVSVQSPNEKLKHLYLDRYLSILKSKDQMHCTHSTLHSQLVKEWKNKSFSSKKRKIKR